jgi:CDP-diacylglycerol---serine O-phosphatidyltransferase
MVFFHILSPTDQYPVFRQIGWVIGFVYLLCAAIRLARFNVITSPFLNPPDSAPSCADFKGMPVPPAAGVIASLVLLMNELNLQKIAFLLPLLMLMIAFLMISTIPFPSFKRIGWQTKMALPTFIAAVVLGVFVLFYPEYTLAFIFWGYMIFGVITGLRKQRRMKQEGIPHE